MLTSYSQENSVSFPAPPYPLQDFKTLYKCCIIIIIFIIPPYGSMGVFSFLFVFLFFLVCMVTDFSAAEKEVWNFACVFDYYLNRFSPILVNFGSQGLMVGHYFQDVRIDTVEPRGSSR